jgi:dihydropteroate synthase
LDEGADIIDVGGESTRPGASPVDAREERRRVVPVVRAVRTARPGARISVDTRRASVAEAALDEGAEIVNDVSAGGDPAMFAAVARRRAGLVLMHSRGTPQTMMALAEYDDVVAETWSELDLREQRARESGVEDLYLDPGLGFAKRPEHCLAILRDLPARTHRRVLLGASRKSFIGALTGQAIPAERIEGSLAVALHARACGVAVLRVHDVLATRRALQTWEAIRP